MHIEDFVLFAPAYRCRHCGRSSVFPANPVAVHFGRMTGLILRRAYGSLPSGESNDDDFDVLADGAVVGRIVKANAASVGSPVDVNADLPHYEEHGYAATREAATA